uniref:Succinate dehydrogenase subunit 3 n=1 Tax=Picea glauca TaxID=3330 RepID=A0A101M323_PICGL|nr:succinate dehydrogenase subunit 3 [Picea glauca]QHR86103.1 succinate dehydrogenase subunit 3 [Picea sitchensis]
MRNLVNPNTNITRPLSPHLTIHKPQFTPTFPIYHRIPGALLATMVSFSPPFGLEIGFFSLTYDNLYQLASGFSVNFPKVALSLVNLTSLAPRYHMGNGVRHLWRDLVFSQSSPIIRISEFPTLCVAFSAFGRILQRIYCRSSGLAQHLFIYHRRVRERRKEGYTFPPRQ